MIERRKTTPQDIVNWTGTFIAIGTMGLLGFALWALVYIVIPTDNQTPLVQLVGGINTFMGMIIGWFFGSSSQAKKQADTIDTLAKTAQTAGTALASNTTGATDALVIPEGQSATATATPNGTVITTDQDVKQ